MRYRAAITALAARLSTRAGVVTVIVPPTEHAAVAEALLAAWPGALRTSLELALLDDAQRVVVEGLPESGPQADAALGRLNDLREILRQHERTLVLLLTPRELRRFEAGAPDVASVAWGHERVRLEPISVPDDTARAALGAWLEASIGRLDLRGFFRSEAEDVSFAVAEIYEQLEVEDAATGQRVRADVTIGQPPRPAVVLGQPGSGKTFFLRWLALTAARSSTYLGIDRPWPILVPLPALDADVGEGLLERIERFLLEQAPKAGHGLAAALAERRVLLLLDGLDEVGDADARQAMAKQIDALADAAIALVVTSRVAGYDEAPTRLRTLRLAPLSDDGIRHLLGRWMRLYFAANRGPAAAAEGHAEGQRLARDVLANPQVRDLAGSPLLLTVLAVIHRAGLRLPEQRVELYAHATQVLVERWNQVRSLARSPGPVMKAVDAVRLLGPVALDLLRHGGRGAISEGRLRSLIAEGLAAGNIRGIASADHAIDVFRRSLGLLVEQSPGWYGFLHLTFIEYFAARELIRSGDLEALAQDRRRAFLPEWREVLLLAAGELGVVRADDRRLRAMVEALIAGARQRRGQPSVVVPALLAGILADDPSLERTTAEALLRTLIPRFWFARAYYRPEDVVEDALALAARIKHGRFGPSFVSHAQRAFESPRITLLLRNRWSPDFVYRLQWWLLQQGLDDSYFLEAWAASAPQTLRPVRPTLHIRVDSLRDGGVTRGVLVSSRLIARAAEGGHRWAIRYRNAVSEPWTTAPLTQFSPSPLDKYTALSLPGAPAEVELFVEPSESC